MILIMSGDYLNSEFVSIFGELPPSFLPVGNKRLYQLQVASFGNLAEEKVLTLPDDFEIPDVDQSALNSLDIEVVRTPPGLSLGSAVVYAINVLNAGNNPVRILHGDTLCGYVEHISLDTVLVGETSDNYPWACCLKDQRGALRLSDGLFNKGQPREVLTGFFTFSNGGNLAQCLTISNNDFISGIDLYSRRFGLSDYSCPDWLDFGHVPLYYRSKATLTTERAFNKIVATPIWIDKTSSDQEKVDAEASWYETLPLDVSMYTPRYLGKYVSEEGVRSYRLEYLYLSTLSELAVYGDLPAVSWQPILECLESLVSKMQDVKPPLPLISATSSDYLEKTLARLSSFTKKESLSMYEPLSIDGSPLPSLLEITETVCGIITNAKESELSLIHGDLCFSNIFYDIRSQQIRVIDPRGRGLNGEITSFGDSRYDIAKLSHSVIGRYDTIVTGRYKLSRSSCYDFELELPRQNNLNEVEKIFCSMKFGAISSNDPSVYAIMISLFLSMLPLHYDEKNRQFALLANALRLFSRLK